MGVDRHSLCSYLCNHRKKRFDTCPLLRLLMCCCGPVDGSDTHDRMPFTALPVLVTGGVTQVTLM